MPDMRPLRPDDPGRIGGFRLLGVLGSGGQGIVYRGAGEDGREVAIKVLHSHLTQDDEVTWRFLREVEAARRVAAFCTAAVLEVGVVDERPYIVSEYVPGDTLQALVRASGPRRGGALDRLAISTLTALTAIHQAEIVHRDFKPGNVLMGPDGPIVIDFGIAKALDATTRTSGPIGTPTYMSPEQFRGERVGPASDVFSWAGTMVYAATGRPPFAGDSVVVIMNAILSAVPGLEGVPAHLRGLIETCLSKDPSARPLPGDLLQRLIRPTGPTARSMPAPPAGGGVAGTGAGDAHGTGANHVNAGTTAAPKAGAGASAGPGNGAGVSGGVSGGAGHGAGVSGGPGVGGWAVGGPAGTSHAGPGGQWPVEATEPSARRTLSRRALIGGAAAVVAAGVSAFAVLRPGGGFLRPDDRATQRTAARRDGRTGARPRNRPVHRRRPRHPRRPRRPSRSGPR
ncbi:serine/threonine-protein kinase [Nonomuraea sp. NPDC050643]|uniref:serine/threonine-protein kinase n=1 Tax=Nonomuraea sp. NPDC050643 TaxID=3155660 RepID=UPI0033DBDE34